MMGVALVTKHIVGNLSKGLRQGCINHSFHCRRCFNSCTLATRCRASILKVGVALIYQAFKIRVGCGYRGIISAQEGYVLYLKELLYGGKLWW